MCSVAHYDVSLAEVTTVILCGCLPIVPKFLKLFHSKSTSRGSSRQQLNGKGPSKQSWNKRDNFSTTPSAPKARAARGDLYDPDLFIDGYYIPLADESSFKPLASKMPTEAVYLRKDAIRKTTSIETSTLPRFSPEVEAIRTAGQLV